MPAFVKSSEEIFFSECSLLNKKKRNPPSKLTAIIDLPNQTEIIEDLGSPSNTNPATPNPSKMVPITIENHSFPF
ncbi:MAG: hypothetical protein ACD_35C00008G0001 [uncultured bacterium]|nr:MAG: hypothetical protein ACD_35C00008G0001 [uncultured bacterium]